MVKVVRVDLADVEADSIPRLCEDALENAMDGIGDKTVVSISQSQVRTTYDSSSDYRSNMVGENSLVYTIVYKA
jgi:hypothetical protein